MCVLQPPNLLLPSVVVQPVLAVARTREEMEERGMVDSSVVEEVAVALEEVAVILKGEVAMAARVGVARVATPRPKVNTQ